MKKQYIYGSAVLLCVVLIASFQNCGNSQNSRAQGPLDEEGYSEVLPGIPGGATLAKPRAACYSLNNNVVNIRVTNGSSYPSTLFNPISTPCGSGALAGSSRSIFVLRNSLDGSNLAKDCRRHPASSQGYIDLSIPLAGIAPNQITVVIKDRVNLISASSVALSRCGGTPPPVERTLRELADAKGIIFGTAQDSPEVVYHLNNDWHLPFVNPTNEPVLFDLNLKHFNSFTPNASMKWAAIRPNESTFDFTANDATIRYARAHNMTVRGHTLVWNLLNPDWLEKGNFTAEKLKKLLETHITQVMTHNKTLFPGTVKYYDVVNEAFTCASSVWDKIGPDHLYAELAFQYAAAADPTAKLIYNDWGNFPAAVAFAKKLKSKGIPIHGIGIQSHLLYNQNYSITDMESLVKQIRDIGLEVQFTEIDVALDANNPTASQLAIQAQYFGDTLKLCLKYPHCTAFITWGVSDKYSSVAWVFPGFGHGLMWDENFKPKPAFYRVRDVLSQ